MDFDELNQKYNEHLKRTQEWLESLFVGAVKLHAATTDILKPPDDWRQDSEGGPYVALIALPQGNKSHVRLTRSELEANADGVFRFAIAITFEESSRSSRKEVLWQAVGVRFRGHEIEYALWDHASDRPVSAQWEKSVVAAAEQLIARFSRLFEVDPTA